MEHLDRQTESELSISVIVPVYNVEKYLSTCLDSLVSQALPEGKRIEILAVNDGSTDRSGEILADYEKKHRCLRVIEQANQGLSGARNTGVRAASGQYLMFVDSDDCLAADSFRKCLQAADRTQADVLYFNCQHIDEKGSRGPVFLNEKSAIAPLQLFDPMDHPQVLGILPSAWSKLYKRSFLQDRQLFFKPGIWFEDLHFYLRLVLAGPRMAYLPETLYLYRQHGASITKSFADERNRAIITVFQEVLPLYQQHENGDCYREELDFLGLDHIYTGVMYTAAKGQNKALFHAIKTFYKANFPLVNRAEARQNRKRLPAKKRMIARLADFNLLFLVGKLAALKKL